MKKNIKGLFIWFIVTLFVVYAFFLNTAGAVFSDTFKSFMHLSDVGAAFAVGSFILGFACMQVPAGYLLDRFFAPYVAVFFFCGSALGIVLFWSGVVGGLAFVAAMLVGLGQGAEFDILPYAISRYFGLRAFGEIYGYTFAAVTLGAAVGPLMMGVSFDATGSYSLALISFAVASFTAAGLMLGLGPYRVWEPAAEPVVAVGVSRA